MNSFFTRHKIITITLIIYLSLITAQQPSPSQAQQSFQSQEQSCKDHPSWSRALKFIKSFVQDQEKSVQESISNFASDFENSKASQENSENLGVCKQYSGQSTCCTRKMANFIEVLPLFRVSPLQQENNIVIKFMNALVKQMQKNTCQSLPSITKPSTIEILASNTQLTNLQTLLSNLKKCKIQFATTLTQFTRGALCSICSGMNNLSYYFDNNENLLISSSSAGAFQSAANSSIQCFQNLVSLKGQNGQNGLLDIAKEVLNFYVDNICTANVLTKIQNIFSNSGVSPMIQGTTTYACSSQQVYQMQNTCTNAQEGNSNIDNLTSNRVLRMDSNQNQNRTLEVIDNNTNDAVIITIGGANVFISSSVDSQITDTGNLNITSSYNYSLSSSHSYLNRFDLLFALVLFCLVLH